jgi:di/tricarboxylate transporter
VLMALAWDVALRSFAWGCLVPARVLLSDFYGLEEVAIVSWLSEWLSEQVE